MSIEGYLGKHVSDLLESEPFKNWPYERSVEDDLEEQIIHYVFSEHTLELRCDKNEKIVVIFLYSDKYSLFEISFSHSRAQVFEKLGRPSKSGEKTSDPILGDYGAWDRFLHSGFAIHIEYRIHEDKIKAITLMCNDVIP